MTTVTAVLGALLGGLLGTAAAALGIWLLRRTARPVVVPAGWCLAASGLLAAAAGASAPALGAPAAAALGALAAWCVLLAAADLAALRLPDVLTLPGALVVLLVAALTGHGRAALLGALALAGLHLAVHLLAPAALGAGDVKLALGLGAAAGACGQAPWLLAALGAAPLTAVLALGLLLTRRSGRRLAVPHGPGMVLATLLAVTAALT